MLPRWPLVWLLLPFVLILSGELPGDDRARPPQEAAPDRAQIDRLIRQLGSGVFDEREAASRQLQKIGPPAVEALRAAAADSKDAEVRRRAADIAAAIENSLDQLLLDYRAFGLPLPPKDAPLVRYEAYWLGRADGKDQPVYGLGFMLKQGNDSGSWSVLDGIYEKQMGWNQKAQEVKPEPDAVKDLVYRKGWGLAIQCHARGWRKLAEYLLEQDRKDAEVPPRQVLIRAAWYYWKDQLTRPKGDRAPIAKRLKDLIGKDQSLDTKRNRALLKSLELALVPSKAKPGSVEALIDDLVDYTGYTQASGRHEPDERYWRLAELGFDAVPALIEHVDDDRLTRAMEGGAWCCPGTSG